MKMNSKALWLAIGLTRGREMLLVGILAANFGGSIIPRQTTIT